MSKLWLLFGALCLAVIGIARLVHDPVTTPAATASLDRQIEAFILARPDVLMTSIQRLRAGETTKALTQLRPQLETPFPGAVGGNPRGNVTLVEFFDFRCPFCRSAHTVLRNVIARDPNVRVVYRDMPILDAPGREPLSRTASKLALAAAKQGRYERFMNAVFEAPGRVSQESLIAAVRAAGLNEARVAKDMEGEDIRASLDGNIRLANTLGIDGTPGFLIGEQVFVGAQEPQTLLDAIARHRANPAQQSAAR